MERLGPSLMSLQSECNQYDCVKIGIELVNDVQKIHELGIIHCDLKVDNILASR